MRTTCRRVTRRSHRDGRGQQWGVIGYCPRNWNVGVLNRHGSVLMLWVGPKILTDLIFSGMRRPSDTFNFRSSVFPAYNSTLLTR